MCNGCTLSKIYRGKDAVVDYLNLLSDLQRAARYVDEVREATRQLEELISDDRTRQVFHKSRARLKELAKEIRKVEETWLTI